MTSSENLPSIETWPFRSALADSSWLSEALALETETLTKALQKSFSNNDNNFIAPETPTLSNVSGSEPETLPKRHRGRAVPGTNAGRITKRKPRASKKSHTTVITADAANFRQLVQQVTGIGFGNAQVPMAPVLKPEPQRPGGGRFAGIGFGCLPTLDTSAFFLDHHQHMGPTSGSGHFDFQTGLAGDVLSTGLDFDGVTSFPTLESCDKF